MVAKLGIHVRSTESIKSDLKLRLEYDEDTSFNVHLPGRPKSKNRHHKVSIIHFITAGRCVSAIFAVVRCPSVRLSVRHVGGIVSTRLKISSNFFLGPVGPSF